MGKWLQGDLRIDKYAWEVDWDGYYLSHIEINISISPLHPLVATWLILSFLFCRSKETFYPHPHTCKGKWDHQTSKRQMLQKAEDVHLTSLLLALLPITLFCQASVGIHEVPPAERCSDLGTQTLRRWDPSVPQYFIQDWQHQVLLLL